LDVRTNQTFHCGQFGGSGIVVAWLPVAARELKNISTDVVGGVSRGVPPAHLIRFVFYRGMQAAVLLRTRLSVALSRAVLHW